MSINLNTKYPGRVNPPDADYPTGSLKNETVPGSSDDGTPVDEEWLNDYEGFKQWLLNESGITPSGNPETINASDLGDSLRLIAAGLLYVNTLDYTVDSYAKGSNGVIYRCAVANGPSSTPVDPVGDLTGTWVASGSVKTTVVSSSDAAWAFDASTTAYEIIAMAGGGSAGSVDGQGAGTIALSEGGGGGEARVLTGTDISETLNITIGAGGPGPSAGNNPGVAGGDTTVLDNGVGAIVNLTAKGGLGGSGDLGNVQGNKVGSGKSPVGSGGYRVAGTSSSATGSESGNHTATSNSGFNPLIGGGVIASKDANGFDATDYGEGGGSCTSRNVATNRLGGDGFQGVVIIKEYTA